MAVINAETLKVNITTVVSIVMASFALYFFVGELIEDAVKEAKIYAVSLDIERDLGVITMYEFRIQNNIHSPNDPARLVTLQAKVSRRMNEKASMQ